MVKQFIKKGPITKTDYWFAEKVKPSLLSSFMQSSYSGKVLGMNKAEFFTIHIDLTLELEEIKKGFNKTTAYLFFIFY